MKKLFIKRCVTLGQYFHLRWNFCQLHCTLKIIFQCKQQRCLFAIKPFSGQKLIIFVYRKYFVFFFFVQIVVSSFHKKHFLSDLYHGLGIFRNWKILFYLNIKCLRGNLPSIILQNIIFRMWQICIALLMNYFCFIISESPLSDALTLSPVG